MTYYTIQDFNTMYSDRVENEFIMDQFAQTVINFLIKTIVVPSDDEVAESSMNTRTNERSFHNKKPGGHQKRYKKDSTADWGNARASIAFKPTKIETKEGIEKQISDIRGLLNKISAKNYDTQKEAIINKLTEILESEGAVENKEHVKIATIIFDIASTNKFFSELYALLYSELIAKFSIFKDVLSGFVERYTKSLRNIHYVDHNVDYDGFCSYTKTNDLRRSMASFIINLMKKTVLHPDEVHGVIIDIQGLVQTYIQEENRTNEVEEIVENMFIFITQSRDQLSKYPDWNNRIMAFVKSIAGMKSKDQKSLSSRAIFKCMDVGEPMVPL